MESICRSAVLWVRHQGKDLSWMAGQPGCGCQRVKRRLTSRKVQTHIDAIHRRICLKPIFSARSATGGEEYINDERMLFEMTQDGLKADPKRGHSKLEAISPGMKEFASLLHAGFDRRS